TGAVAPFSLITYSDAAKRAALIARVTSQRFMPPWLPIAPHFKDERRLSELEIAAIGRWAAAGAPEGNPAEAPQPPRFSDDWPLGKPDLEVTMPAPFDVPAEGADLYQCFAIRIPVASRRYVRAIDIRPGNARVV